MSDHLFPFSVCLPCKANFSILGLHSRGCIAETKWGVFSTCEDAPEGTEPNDTLIPRLASWVYSCINTVVQKSILVYAISKCTFPFYFGFLYVKFLATDSVCIWTFMGLVQKVDPDVNRHLLSRAWDISTSQIILLCTAGDKN